MAKLEGLIKGLGEKVNGLGEQFNGLGEQVKGLGEQVKGMGEKIDRLGMRIGGLEGKFDGLEMKFDSFKDWSMSHFDALYNKLDVLKHDEYYSLLGGLKRVEDEHRIIDHATILKEIKELKSSKN